MVSSLYSNTQYSSKRCTAVSLNTRCAEDLVQLGFYWLDCSRGVNDCSQLWIRSFKVISSLKELSNFLIDLLEFLQSLQFSFLPGTWVASNGLILCDCFRRYLLQKIMRENQQKLQENWVCWSHVSSSIDLTLLILTNSCRLFAWPGCLKSSWCRIRCGSFA